MQRRRRAFWRIAAPLVAPFAALGLQSGRAEAYEEQISADVALGYSGLAANDRLPGNLPAIDLGAAVGISDWLVVRTAFGYGALLGGGDMLHVGRGRLEVAYLLDILQWVPFFGVGGGLWALQGPSGLGLRPAGHLWFGVDYLATREWTVGLDTRTGLLWQRGDTASFTEGQLRFSRTFEMF